MSLLHDSFTFFSHDHGLIVPEGDYETRVTVGTFIGVIGESHIIDETKGRNLSCPITFADYSTLALLQADFDTLASKNGKLTGTLTETIGAVTRTFRKCTFLGLTSDPRGPFWDGSNVNGWVLFGRLNWRQRSRV